MNTLSECNAYKSNEKCKNVETCQDIKILANSNSKLFGFSLASSSEKREVRGQFWACL